MDWLISDAMAQAQPAGGVGGQLAQFLPLILIFIVFYFLLIRPQVKRAKEHKKMVDSLAKGDEVVTNGGLLGRIADTGEDFLVLEVANGVEVRVQRNAVAAVMPKGTVKQST